MTKIRKDKPILLIVEFIGYFCMQNESKMKKEYDIKVKNVHDYNSFIGTSDDHKLVSVVCYNNLSSIRHCRALWGVYGIFLLEDELESLSYGQHCYDYHKGSIVCVAPSQIGGAYDDGTTFERKGWALLFHPDLFQGQPFMKQLPKFEFFNYHINEALPIGQENKDNFTMLLGQLKYELGDNMRNNEEVIRKYIELILTLCMAYYQQYYSSSIGIKSSHIVSRMEEVLSDYYNKKEQLKKGLPTVNLCADRMCISPNYLGDLIKQETGDSAIRFIGKFIIQYAKNLLIEGHSIADTAYTLGFDYPSHLSRLFKRLEEKTPTEYMKNAN